MHPDKEFHAQNIHVQTSNISRHQGYGKRRSPKSDKPGFSQKNRVFLPEKPGFSEKLSFSGEKLGFSEKLSLSGRKTKFFSRKTKFFRKTRFF